MKLYQKTNSNMARLQVHATIGRGHGVTNRTTFLFFESWEKGCQHQLSIDFTGDTSFLFSTTSIEGSIIYSCR